MNAVTCALASLGGNVHVLTFLHESECKWDASTCTNAAIRGSLDCLRYLTTFPSLALLFLLLPFYLVKSSPQPYPLYIDLYFQVCIPEWM